MPTRTSTRDIHKLNTPVKRKVSKRKLDIPELPKLTENGLPGKKPGRTSSKQQKPGTSNLSKKPTNTATPSHVPDKCAVCNIIWDSKEDVEFRKKNRNKEQASWIGCDVNKCKYWGHAVCTNIQLVPRKKLSQHNFLCPKHRT